MIGQIIVNAIGVLVVCALVFALLIVRSQPNNDDTEWHVDDWKGR